MFHQICFVVRPPANDSLGETHNYFHITDEMQLLNCLFLLMRRATLYRMLSHVVFHDATLPHHGELCQRVFINQFIFSSQRARNVVVEEMTNHNGPV